MACNPSIAADREGMRAIVRTVNYRLSDDGVLISLPGGRQMTSNWLAKIGRDLAVVDAQLIDDTAYRGEDIHPGGFEDCRLFRWNGGWWMSATVVVKFAPAVAKIALCRLDGVRVAERQLIESPSQEPIEKNWMPIVAGRRLGWIYRIDSMALVWLNDGGAPTLERIGKADLLEGWSGSSQCLRYRGRWLCVVHRRKKQGGGQFYEHRFVEIDRSFGIRRMSESFLLERPAVEFCAGLCFLGCDVVLSYGVFDREARLLRLSRSDVERLLREGPIPRGLTRIRRAFDWR